MGKSPISMIKPSTNPILIILLVVTLHTAIFTPASIAAGAETQFAATVGEILKPENWFDVLKKNITIPVLDEKVNVPTPAEALEGASSTLQGINEDIKEEVGIDFAKFFGWFASVLKAFFQFIVSLIETVSKTLSG